MKKISFLLIFFNFIYVNRAKADWYEIDARGKVVPISKIAKIGKISVFMISTSWCAPCIGLKKRLQATEFDMSKVDFYYVLVADNQTPDFEKSNAYETWRRIEGLEAFPMIYIAAPTSNIVSKLGKKEYNPYEKIIQVVNGLLEDSEHFKNATMYKEKEHDSMTISAAPDNQQHLPNKQVLTRHHYVIHIPIELTENELKAIRKKYKKEQLLPVEGQKGYLFGYFSNQKDANDYLKYFKKNGYTNAAIVEYP
jgi:hypothetical protein